MMTNTPHGNWDGEKRTLTIGPKQFDWYKQAELRQSLGVDRDLDDMLHLYKRVLGPGEIKLIVDPSIE